MAAEAGTETEYGFIITSEKFENTCVSHGKSLKSKYAIGTVSSATPVQKTAIARLQNGATTVRYLLPN